jgi:hypothetical protein
MSQNLLQDPSSGLILPGQFIDQKQALKKVIDDLVDECVYGNQHLSKTYYLTLHARFDKFDPSKFVINRPVITYRLPPFTSNQFVFWVNNKKGICELLWMVCRGQDGKLKVEFNNSGVAYLQAKGAMPT